MDEPQKPTDQQPQPTEPAAEPLVDTPVSEPAAPETPAATETTPESAIEVPAPTPSEPTRIASQEPASQPVATDSGKKKLSRLFFVLAAVFLLAAVGIAAWYLTKSDDRSAGDEQSQQNQATPSGSDQADADSSLLKTVFDPAFESGGNATASVEHPASWEVFEEEDADGMNHTAIGSPDGHWLHLFEVFGFGGTCDPDTDTYTLIKKLPTSMQDVYFTEYKVEGESRNFALEDFGRMGPNGTLSNEHKELKEGETNTNVCNNLFYYPVHKGIFATVSNTKERDGGDLGFDAIKDDIQFLAMLQSLRITEDEGSGE